METGGPPTIEILLLVFGIPAVLVLLAYGMVFWLRRQSQAAIRGIAGEIQKHSERLNRIADFLREFIGIDQEPYSTYLDELQKEASSLQEEMQRFLSDSRNFEQEIYAAGIKRFRDIINAPYDWLRRWQRSGTLRQESKAIDGRLTEAEGRIAHINDLPWELARQCRQIDKDITEIVDTARNLQAKGARGAALQAILNLIPQFGRSLDEIPDEFMQADQESLIASTNLDATIRVFEVLNRLKPAADRYLPQVREWATAYQKASTEFVELKQAGATLRQAIAQPPAGLVVTGLQDRLDQTAQLAAELGQALAQPEVEQLKSMAREIGQLRRVIQDIGRQLEHSSQQVTELGKLIGELQAGREKLAGQLSSLESRATFPLNWDMTRRQHSDLGQQLQALGPVQQPRTPEQITQHLKTLDSLRGAHQTHTEAYPRVAGQHSALIALLESPELKQGAAWLRKAHEMAGQTADYDPHNWVKQDSVQTLSADLDVLSQLYKQVIPADSTTPVKESELGQRLKDTQQVMAQYKALQPRVESVRARLEKIQAEEKEGKDKLTGAYTAMERVALLAESNDLLDTLASAEIDRLSEEIRQLGNELNDRAQGEVEKKLQKIQAEAEKVNRALNGWLTQLNTAIAGLGKDIDDRMAQLDAVALLDEPIIDDARSVLAREEYRHALQSAPAAAASPAGALRGVAARVTARASGLNELEASAAIKRQNDLWQTLQAVRKGLEERTGALLTAYQETVQARTEVRQGLADMAKCTADRRAWPPGNQPALTEAQVLRPIDDKWDGLKKQAHRIEPAILELGRLTQQYKLASERIQQWMGRVDQDNERVQDLEDQIGGLKQRWVDQAQAVPNNAVVHEGVQQLMSQADSRLAYIKHQYMRGALTYEQVVHNLQLLCDELLTARVSIDDQTDIGLNEPHHHAQQT